MTGTAALAVSLVRPVVRGWLPIADAEVALALAISKAMEAGRCEGSGTIEDRLRIDVSILRQHIEREETKRDITHARIRQTIKPRIARHERWNALMAEAHQVNADDGFPFAEAEVTALVEYQVWLSLPVAPAAPVRGVRRRPRHG